jgi:transcriptional regulator with GAF, ATPase, and Fis domain
VVFNRDARKATETSSGGAAEISVDPGTVFIEQELAVTDPADLARSYRRLQLLYNMGLAICSEVRVEGVLAEVVAACSKLIEMERCFVATTDERGRLAARAAHNIVLPPDFAEWPVSRSLIQRVMSGGVALLSGDAQDDSQFVGHKSVVMHNMRSVMCVPLGPKASCCGVLYVDNRSRRGSFSEMDLKFLTALSHYIYLAIRHAAQLERAEAYLQRSDERWAVLQRELLHDHKIVGRSPKLLAEYEKLRRAAESEVPILLLGESGTGKELFARAAHHLSARAKNVFVAVNLAETNENLIESELFGHE